MKFVYGRTLMQIALAVVLAEPVVANQAANWSTVPLAKWRESVTLEGPDMPQPHGKWAETNGALSVTGLVNRWSTMLAPGDQGANQKLNVRFKVRQSSNAPFSLPGYCSRWGYHWGENDPGWDFGVVLRFKDGLNFYRVQVSVARGQLALWDSTGGFLQVIPCAIKTNELHMLEITARGAHFQAVVDGAAVMDYWDRTLPHESGQVGLAVYKSTTLVEGFNVAKLKADAQPMPPHQPKFHFEAANTSTAVYARSLVLYDGYEPISFFWKDRRNPKNPSEYGQLYQEAIKLKPGWRPALSSQVGPFLNDNSGPELVGELPGAFQVEGGGTSIAARFKMSLRWMGDLAAETLTVRYDAQRGVYRYEYQVKQTFTNTTPVEVPCYQVMDPLTYNNRSPGPEVEHLWNPAGHRWWVYQGTNGNWERFPMVDYLEKYNNPKVPWSKATDFLYPDPAACPAFEVEYGWPKPDKWSAELGLCTWGYDFHHRADNFPAMKLKAGDKLNYSATYTALLPDEARKRFRESKLRAGLETDSTQLVPFDPSGKPLVTTMWRDPSATMVWGGDGVFDATGGRHGKPALRIDGPGSAGVGMYHYAIEQYAKRWWVRGWFKTKGVRGRGLELCVKYAYQPQPQDMFYLGGLGDKDWTRFSYITTAPKAPDCTWMSFGMDGPGQVWLEGVQFSALKEGDNPEVTSFTMPSGLDPNKEILIDLPMKEKPGKAVYDESRNGHALHLANVGWTQESGRGFLSFNGSNGTASIGVGESLTPRDSPPNNLLEQYKSLFRLDRFTYEFWVRPRLAVKPNWRMMVLAYLRGPFGYIEPAPGKPGECQFSWETAVFKNMGLEKLTVKQNIPYDQWSHVAISHGDGRVTLYVNGKAVDEAKYDPKTAGFYFFAYSNGQQYYVGCFYGDSNCFHGDLGPLRLYAKALTAAEVAERYRSGWSVGKP